jgi:hypothetical protein
MNDAFDATDGSQWAFTKGVSNVVLMSDTRTTAFSKALTETLSLLESITLDVTKNLADSATISDAYAASVSLTKAETVSLADNAAISFVLAPRADSVSVSDTSTRTPEKGLSESASAADAGYLYSQGYCDLTYFASDYVGAYRTF